MMHVPTNVKFVDAKQVKETYQYECYSKWNKYETFVRLVYCRNRHYKFFVLFFQSSIDINFRIVSCKYKPGTCIHRFPHSNGFPRSFYLITKYLW